MGFSLVLSDQTFEVGPGVARGSNAPAGFSRASPPYKGGTHDRRGSVWVGGAKRTYDLPTGRGDGPTPLEGGRNGPDAGLRACEGAFFGARGYLSRVARLHQRMFSRPTPATRRKPTID